MNNLRVLARRFATKPAPAKQPFIVPGPVSMGSGSGFGAREAAIENAYFSQHDRELLLALARQMKKVEGAMHKAGVPVPPQPDWLKDLEYEGAEARADYEHEHEHDLDAVIAARAAAGKAQSAGGVAGANPILPQASAGSGTFGSRESAAEDRYVWVERTLIHIDSSNERFSFHRRASSCYQLRTRQAKDQGPPKQALNPLSVPSPAPNAIKRTILSLDNYGRFGSRDGCLLNLPCTETRRGRCTMTLVCESGCYRPRIIRHWVPRDGFLLSWGFCLTRCGRGMSRSAAT